MPSPYYFEFFNEVKKGEQSIPLFEEILTRGSSPARLYSALALYSLNSERGIQALESLRDDSSPLRMMSGCSVFSPTIGELAAQALEEYRKGKRDFFSDFEEGDDGRDILWRR